MKRSYYVALLLIVLAGCNTTPNYNKPLTQYSPSYGYRFENLEPGQNSDSLFVILTFSGGGTRASALSLGILQKLAATEIEWEGRRTSLLDEVDLISSVSGGSFTAAYYGAFKDQVFTDFKEVLYQKNDSTLIKAAFSLPNMIKQASPSYSRTDTAANRYQNNVFEGATYGDLLENGERPFILINSTDMGSQSQFSFTQDTFDLLYSDLSTYPLGYAVAASSAFPGAFSALLLKNYPPQPDFVIDPWYGLEIEKDPLGNSVRRMSEAAEAYLDPEKKFVHLSDGGVSDNLGLLPIIQNLAHPYHPLGLIPPIAGGVKQKVVLIVVNAGVQGQDTLSLKGKPLGLFKLLSTAGSTPLGWFTTAQIAYLQLMLEVAAKAQVEDPSIALSNGTNVARRARSEAERTFHFTEVAFDKIPDTEQRDFFNSIPTKFTLPPETVDRLLEVGGEIMDIDPVFQDLLDEIGAK